MMAVRLDAPFRDPHDVRRRGGLSASSLELLAQADAWRSLGLERRAALWAVQALGPEPLPLFARIDGAVMDEPEVTVLPRTTKMADDFGGLDAHRVDVPAHGLGHRIDSAATQGDPIDVVAVLVGVGRVAATPGVVTVQLHDVDLGNG